MNKRRSLTQHILRALLFASLALVTSAQNDEPIGPPKPVVIGNTQTNPVPVSGQISIGNMPTVDARQSGSWNVGILGTPTVKLDPTANLVTMAARTTQVLVNTGQYDVSTGGYLALGPFNVSGYSRVRVVAYNSSDSAGMFYIIPRVQLGNIPFNLDEGGINGWIPLEPGKMFSRTYDIPGTGFYVGVAGNGTERIGSIAVFAN